MGRWTAALMAVAMVMSGCAQSEGTSTATRRDSAGIRIVENGGSERPLAASLNLAYRLGGKSSGPESFYELYPWQVGVSAKGVIGVLDHQGHRVSTFNVDGSPIATYGREGGGPGEFRYPSSIAVEPNGGVLVYDYGKKALVPFAADGTVLDERPLTVPFNGVRMVATASGLVLLSENRQGSEGKTTSRVLYLSATDTVQLGPSASSSFKMVRYQSCGVVMRQPPLFASELVWGSNGVRTAVAGSPDYSIWIFDDTTLVDVIRRDLQPEQVTEEVAKREVGEGEHWEIGGRECLVPGNEVLEERGYGPVVPIVEAVVVTPEGGLWVKRRNPGTQERSVDVFDNDGQYLGTMTPSPPFPVAFLPGERFIAIEKDSLDVQTLAVYGVQISGT